MEATPLNLVRPEVPVELAALVAKMMAKEPERRFQEPREVAQALTPFFKKGSVAFKGATPDISQAGQDEAKPAMAGAVSTSTRPSTEMMPAPASVGKKPAPTPPGSILEGLIDVGGKDPLFDTLLDRTPPAATVKPSEGAHRAWSTAIAKLSRLGPRHWWIAAGVLLFGLIVTWAAGILKVKTARGVIVLENLPENAVIEVDGDRVTVTPHEGEPIQIEATAGKHGVVVKRGNELLLGESVTIESGKPFKLTVRLESPAASQPGKTSPPAEESSPVSGTVVTERHEPIVSPTKMPDELPKGDGTATTRTAKNDPHPNAGPALKPPSIRESIKNSIEMTFNLIPAGEFMMGSLDDDTDAAENEKPQHQVRLSAFYLGIYEVTQAEYEAVMGNNPSRVRLRGRSTARHPVRLCYVVGRSPILQRLECEGRSCSLLHRQRGASGDSG